MQTNISMVLMNKMNSSNKNRTDFYILYVEVINQTEKYMNHRYSVKFK
jgi:hypothetical protein